MPEAKHPVFMNLMTDFAFKRLFGTPERKQILIRFLNILFAADNIKVEDVIFRNKEILPESPEGKRILYDVYCTTPEEKEHIIVEMQQVYHDFFENRSVFYASKIVSGQALKGREYDLRPVYSIFLVDFHFAHMTRKGIHDVRLMDIHSHEIYSDLMRMLFVHLTDTKENWDDCQTDYDKILFIIKNMHKMDKESKAYKSGEFEDMFREAEIDGMVAEDVVAYGDSVQKYYDNLAAVNYASRSSYEKGKEEGREEGREEGLVLSARRLLEAGMSKEFIKSITGITL